jgi:hypothetical protein
MDCTPSMFNAGFLPLHPTSVREIAAIARKALLPTLIFDDGIGSNPFFNSTIREIRESVRYFRS